MILILFSLLFFLFGSYKTAQASISNLKDTISTSRPSATGTLNVGISSGNTQAIINASGSRFIASDSARLIGGTTEMATIASMSAVSGGTAAVYFTQGITQTHGVGSTVMTSIPAQHVVTFSTNTVPASGNIQVVLPVGNTSNPEYASPNGFSFNGLASGNLSASFSPSGPSCGSWTITPASGLVQCNMGVGITGVTTVTLNIGLTSTNPALVNPTKTATSGTQDTWTIRVKTNDASSIEIDNKKAQIATIESVEVYATVDAFINFSITGIANGAAVNIGNTGASGCGSTEPTNSGTASTTTEVNLGTLATNRINLSAQLLTVSTNASSGYALTATASGHLIDSSVGYWLPDAQGNPTANDTPIPNTMATGTPTFGIHACGQDVNTTTWGPNICTSSIDCKFANPSATYYYTLANDTSGPIGSGSADSSGDGLTSVAYGATINSVVPAGTYHNTLTYVATATF